MGTTIESSWENTRLQDQNAMLRSALLDCERVGELLAYAGHKDEAQKIFDAVSESLQRSLGNLDTEQVGWIYDYPDLTTNIPPVISRHRLDNKSEWVERPIYAVEKVEGERR